MGTAGRPLVLVVDDDHEMRDLLCMMLGGDGYRVVAAADGGEGLDIARRDGPDLILVDAMMPHLDGAAFCWAYFEGGGSAPVVLISAGNSDVIATTIEACGAAAFVTKPFDVDEVLDMIARLLGRPSPQMA